MSMKNGRRGSGVLLHISSLPSRYGIGTLGQKAYEFIDFLSETRQKYWQVLPVCPTSYGDSPYQSPSAFAGNPYFIDLDFLINDGLLDGETVMRICGNSESGRVNYGSIYVSRQEIFNILSDRFSDEEPRFIAFCEENGDWLDDYALFSALKEESGGRCWSELDRSLKFRDKEALEKEYERLYTLVRKYKILQYIFFRQWFALKSYAKTKGVKIIGDMPIYVAYDSCDVWRAPEMFKLDGDLYPSEVAGCPPDAFSPEGQLWGNPVYYWESPDRRDKIYDWWRRRLLLANKMFDTVRIDHFRAFADYYSIPAGSPNARNGEWKLGVGEGFFRYLKSELGDLSIIAEDLGFLTEEVKKLLRSTGFPGMKILQFAFDSDAENEYLPHNYERNSVAYLCTHDNATSKEWLESLPENEYEKARNYMRLYDRNDVWGMIAAVMSSVSDTAIFTVQDLLCLGKEGRMNIPSTNIGNWTFRVPEDYIWRIDRLKLKSLTEMYGR